MCDYYWYQVAAFLLAFKGIENLAKSDGPLSFSDIFTNPIFRNIVLSLLATLGLYIIASIIFVSLFIPKSLLMDYDPRWVVRALAYDHVVRAIPPHGAFVYQRSKRLRCKLTHHTHSFIPSLPPFLNSQFANVHDVSWGTKGDNTVAKDLGTVTTGKTGKKGEVEAEVPTDEKDINALYEDAIHVLNTKPPKVDSKPDKGTQQEDYYRTFRTKCVFFEFFRRGC